MKYVLKDVVSPYGPWFFTHFDMKGLGRFSKKREEAYKFEDKAFAEGLLSRVEVKTGGICQGRMWKSEMVVEPAEPPMYVIETHWGAYYTDERRQVGGSYVITDDKSKARRFTYAEAEEYLRSIERKIVPAE